MTIHAFTDRDDHQLKVFISRNRVRFSVVDCRPSLTGHELQRFTYAVFHVCAAPPLSRKLASALVKLAALYGELADRPALRRKIAAVQRAIGGVHSALTPDPDVR